MTKKKDRVDGQVQRKVSLFLCWLIGHKVTDNDSGYDLCGRCEKHAYYDEKEWDNCENLFKPFRWLKEKYNRFISWYKYKKDNELPF